MPVVIGAVAVLLVGTWLVVEAVRIVSAHAVEFAVGSISFGVIAVAATAARFWAVTHNQVALPAPPPRRAIAAPPGLMIAPYLDARVTPGTCEGPACGRPHGADPYAVEVARPGEKGEEHRFCSRSCLDNWISADRRA